MGFPFGGWLLAVWAEKLAGVHLGGGDGDALHCGACGLSASVPGCHASAVCSVVDDGEEGQGYGSRDEGEDYRDDCPCQGFDVACAYGGFCQVGDGFPHPVTVA